MNCLEGFTCDNGQCVATPQCTDGMRNCVSDTIYSCKGGQWQLLLQCPSNTDCKESSGSAYCAAETPVQPAQPPGILSDPLGVAAIIVVTLAVAGIAAYLFMGKKK
jgi:hypothetical protein